MTGFADVVEPAASLVPPAAPEEYADPLEFFNVVADFLSPNQWLLKMTELITGTDPVKWAGEKLAGDWKSYAACASAWQAMGHACDGIARNLRSGNTRIDAAWDGNAAGSAAHYFAALAGSLEEFHRSLDAMGAEYLAISRSVTFAAAGIADCLTAMLDALITASIEVTASAATGGGAAVMAAALGTEELLTILREWEHMNEFFSAAQTVMHAGSAALVRTGAETLTALSAFPVPRTAYDHPAV
ncbi:hypothetical protein [Streptomyces roseoverticillatus]|uniref:Uncharacterized protein n=1 Tax=Streptomyces roseoverticillatus TaxID=66429 RepID=A0ABV3IWD6_9ACTN